MKYERIRRICCKYFGVHKQFVAKQANKKTRNWNVRKFCRYLTGEKTKKRNCKLETT